MDYRSLSLWHDTLPEPLTPRPRLPGPTDVDVAIVGAGFTGLWAAYYLSALDPTVRIAVLERDIAGFGASGRNGGWCSALFAASAAKVARGAGRDAAIAQQRAMRDTVAEVGRVAVAEDIDCDWAHGGTLVLAMNAAQEQRLRHEVDTERTYGATAGDVCWLSPAEAAGRIDVAGARGGVFTPHCAAIHPAKLVRALARVVAARGVQVFERTPVTAVSPGRVSTPYGQVRADVVIRATEGYTPGLAGHRRVVAPVYSLMIATEPLPASFWDSVGWRSRETLSDGRHLLIYAQRTADDRIAFGGRGAPYHFGSAIRPGYDREPRVFAELERVLRALFPAAGEARITHRWGGPLGVPRDWYSSVGLDRATGLGWAGGYVGDGVGTSNLAGRTLADLVLRRDTDLVRLPWVGHRSRRWEPEPLRWLGMNAGLRVMASADGVETRTGRPARRAAVAGRFLGG